MIEIEKNKDELLQEIEALKKENALLKAMQTDDISQNKSVDYNLTKSEEQFRSLVWGMQVGVLLQGPHAEILMSNPKALELLGISEDQLLGRTSFDPEWNVIHEDGSPFPGNTHPVPQAIATQKPVLDVVMGVYHPEKRNRIWLVVDATPQFKSDGTIYHVICTFIDITEQKHAQEILVESEEKYKSLFNNNHSIMFLIEPVTGGIVDANTAACNYYGWSHKEITTKNISEINTLSPSEIKEAMQKAKEEKRNQFYFRHRLANNEVRDVEVFSGPITIGGKSLLYSIVHDITKRKQVEEKLMESEDRLARAEKVAKIGNWKLLMDSKQMISSSGARIIYGIDKDTMSLHDIQKIPLPEYRNLLDKAFDDLITKNITYSVEYKICRPNDGKILDIHSFADYDKENNIMFGVIHDITERKNAEDELRKKTEELDNYFTNALDLFCIANTDGYFLKLNNEWEFTLGYKLDELEGIRFLDLVHPDDLPSTLETISKLADQKHILNFTNRYRTKDGSYRIIEWRSKPNGNLIYAAARDITARKLVEEEIKKKNIELIKINSEKDKFFSIIAHDLRSPFAGLLNLTEYMANESQNLTISEFAKVSNSLFQSASKVFELLNNLLEWAMMQQGQISLDKRKLNLYEIVSMNTATMKELASQKNIFLINNVDDSFDVLADEKMINSILRNLLSNAIKFTNAKGTVTLSAKELDDDLIEILVADDGIGMPEDILKNLFKIEEKVGRPGTEGENSIGLGLVLCKEFVEKLGGNISVTSKNDSGSNFYFTLPKVSTEKESILNS